MSQISAARALGVAKETVVTRERRATPCDFDDARGVVGQLDKVLALVGDGE